MRTPHRNPLHMGSSTITSIACEPDEHPYGKGVHDAYAQMTGLAEWGELSDIAKFALEKEGEYIERYQKEQGIKVYTGQTFYHPGYDYMCCTPDAYDFYSRRVIEIKHLTVYKLSQWNVDEQVVPMAVRIQNTWQTGIFNMNLPNGAKPCEVGHIYASVAGFAPVLYENPFDPEAFNALVTLGEDFYESHVLPRIPPPPDYSSACNDFIAQYFPANYSDKEQFAESDEINSLLGVLGELKKQQESIDATIHGVKTQLKYAIGEDNYGVRNPENGDRMIWYGVPGKFKYNDIIADLAERAAIGEKELNELKESHRGKPSRTSRFIAGKEEK